MKENPYEPPKNPDEPKQAMPSEAKPKSNIRYTVLYLIAFAIAYGLFRLLMAA